MGLAEDAVDAMNAVSGRHPGRRAAHAKGTLLSGTFTAHAGGRPLTRAQHMQGDPLRATVRVSNGGGDPGVPDYAARDGRGLAVKLYLEDGTKTDMVALSLPVFFVRTPEDFVEFTRLLKPDPETGRPDMEVLGAWLGEHPEAGPAIQAALGGQPPASYAQVAYNGIHAFRWTGPDGESRFVRFRWEPEAGEAAIGRDEARERGPDYLAEEILERGRARASRLPPGGAAGRGGRPDRRPHGGLAAGTRARGGGSARADRPRARARARAR